MRRFRIGEWEVDPARNRASRGDQDVELQPRQMDLLVRLAAAPGGVVSKEELLNDVWGGRAVVEHVVPKAVSGLRSALGENARRPRLIETIPRRGYRLATPVTPVLEPRRAGRAPRRRRDVLRAARAAMVIALPLVVGPALPGSPEVDRGREAMVRLSPDEAGLPLEFSFRTRTRVVTEVGLTSAAEATDRVP